MQVKKICPILEPIINNLVGKRNTLIASQLLGDYGMYRKASQDYAEYGIKHIGLLKCINYSRNLSFPLFSKEVLNMSKISIMDMFRKKSPEERTFKKLMAIARLEKEYGLNITV